MSIVVVIVVGAMKKNPKIFSRGWKMFSNGRFCTSRLIRACKIPEETIFIFFLIFPQEATKYDIQFLLLFTTSSNFRGKKQMLSLLFLNVVVDLNKYKRYCTVSNKFGIQERLLAIIHFKRHHKQKKVNTPNK